MNTHARSHANRRTRAMDRGVAGTVPHAQYPRAASVIAWVIAWVIVRGDQVLPLSEFEKAGVQAGSQGLR